MVLNDPLANALSKIFNAEHIGKKTCLVKPLSLLLVKVLTIMKEQGYIGEFERVEDGCGGYLKINLLGKINHCNAIKPRFAVGLLDYERFEKRFLLSKNFGFLVVSTPQGLMTQTEAIEQHLGGRLLAYCY